MRFLYSDFEMRDAGECRYPAFIFKVFQKLHSAMNSVEHSGKENLGYPTELNYKEMLWDIQKKRISGTQPN